MLTMSASWEGSNKEIRHQSLPSQTILLSERGSLPDFRLAGKRARLSLLYTTPGMAWVRTQPRGPNCKHPAWLHGVYAPEPLPAPVLWRRGETPQPLCLPTPSACLTLQHPLPLPAWGSCDCTSSALFREALLLDRQSRLHRIKNTPVVSSIYVRTSSGDTEHSVTGGDQAQ